MTIKEYKIGETTSTGVKVKSIIASNAIAIVFFNENNEVNSEISEISFDIGKVMHKHDELRFKISDELPPKVMHALLFGLGKALFHAVNSDNIEDALNNFNGIENRISNVITPNQAKSILILCNIFFSLAVIAICLVLFRENTSPNGAIFLCLSMGAFGALFSLLQRNSVIELNLTGGYKYIVLQSIFICVLGSMSGSVMYLLIKSGIAFSFAENNIFSMSIFSIISGFSERLVPDLFSSIEKTSKSN